MKKKPIVKKNRHGGTHKRDIKLYFALLNHGTMLTGMTTEVLPAMQRTPGVKLFWEHPSKTWHHPISSNRNRIVKRFLADKNECDFLLMIDDDVLPHTNPAEMVFADCDIVGSPALVRQNNHMINWVAYVKHPALDGYAPVDFAGIEGNIDLLKVDIVGTGCIMIARRVLEDPRMKAPFNCEYDEDGITEYGTDYAFCRKAGALGYNIFTTPKRRCEHFKKVGLSELDGYCKTEGIDPSPVKYNIPYGGFAITQKDWHFIRDIIQREKIENILEFGAGLSSLLMSELAQVTTYERDEVYTSEIAKRMNGNKLTIHLWDGIEISSDPVDFALCFVDGPKGKAAGGEGRQRSIQLASRCKRVIVHDAGRVDETTWQEKYLEGNGFKMQASNGWHRSRCQYWVKNVS